MKKLTPPPTTARDAREAISPHDRVRWTRVEALRLHAQRLREGFNIVFDHCISPSESIDDPANSNGVSLAFNCHDMAKNAALIWLSEQMAEHPAVKAVDAVMRAALEETAAQADYDRQMAERRAETAAALAQRQAEIEASALAAAENDPEVRRLRAQLVSE